MRCSTAQSRLTVEILVNHNRFISESKLVHADNAEHGRLDINEVNCCFFLNCTKKSLHWIKVPLAPAKCLSILVATCTQLRPAESLQWSIDRIVCILRVGW